MAKKTSRSRQKKIAQLYDRLFKLFMTVAEVAQGIVQTCAPRSVRQLLDLSFFVPVSSAHISGRFGVSFSDVIYQTRLKNGNSARVLFLFEHKSAPPNYPVHLQLLDYIKQLWEDDLRHKRPPSLIISIVLYHGERPWIHKALVEEMFGSMPRSVWPYIPNFRYIAINLNEMTVEDILEKIRPGYLQSLFILLKFARNLTQLGQHLPFVWAAFKERVSDIRARMLGQSTVQYIESLLDMNEITVSDWVKLLPPFGQKAYLEMLEEYRQKVLPEEMERAEMRGIEKGLKLGREEGRQEGREEMLHLFVRSLLREKPEWDDAKIAALTHASQELVAQIRQQLAEETTDGPSNN
ncbi:MAG: Rpn family recombination-promoting nuclease/putative transposase [Saprospiraceae bacterium]|nr:Rpn family recombination-promoting nuclease/putative transposase [Saprospiraceae bacterium]MDW8228486.1 Rpn family recombination-promoting nuclease/putative transposase [Saprospiraceae bacterium]